jgi:hypothetical protein
VSLLLREGERGLIIGQTGSGKTAGATVMIDKSPIYPKILIDTKGEPKFDRFLDGKNIHVESFGEFAKLRPKTMPDYVVIRPNPMELLEPGIIDGYLARVYNHGRPCLLYVDELYQVHGSTGRAGVGLKGVLTRGRSKGITCLMGAQRPSWIARECLTESQKFYIYRILDKRDRKSLSEIIPNFDRMTPAEKYHFYAYDAGEDSPKYYKPFEYQDVTMPDSIRLKTDGWI